jgi:hypothetical protein
MQSQERDSVAAFLEDAVSAGRSSAEVAKLVARALLGIDKALAPIVGQRGVAALYRRSLHRCRPTTPWLPAAADGADPTVFVDSAMDIASLNSALASRTAMEAALAGTQLLESLCTLLNGLIGESLTERLLRPVWATFLSGASAQDTKTCAAK